MSRYSPYNSTGVGEWSGSGSGQRPCKFFQLGQCSKGSACNYTHETDANLTGLLALAAAVASGVEGADKAGICKFFAMGACSKGAACTYKHALQGAAAGGVILPPNAAFGNAAGANARTGQYKGALCKFFQQSATCSAGAACTYAHGLQELAGGYKQRLCKFFEETGSCSKGDACTYAHGSHELLMTGSPPEAVIAPATGLQALTDEQKANAWSIVQAAPKILPLLSSLGTWQPSLPSESSQTVGGSQKAMMCKFWEMGQCIKGAACTFAHGVQDMQGGRSGASVLNGLILPVNRGSTAPAHGLIAPPGASWGRTNAGGPDGSGPGANGGQRKGALCKYFQQGVTCNSGAACTYAHGIHELAGGFKQRMCKFFEQTGNCTKGDSCTYAHGAHELLVGEALASAAILPASEESWSAAQGKLSSTAPAAGSILPLLDSTNSWAGSTGAESSGGEKDSGYKASMCKYWVMGQCIKGFACTFAHGDHELQSGSSSNALADALLLGAGADLQTLLSLAAAAPRSGTSWGADARASASGPTSYKRALCKYYEQGTTCPTGESCTYAHGVQELAQGYKKQLCKFFQETGNCIKGSGCTFAHGSEELQAI